MPSGVTSTTVAPSGKFLMLSVKSYVPPNSTCSASASTVGAFCVAVAVIVLFSAVIAVPAGVDQVGFSYPSFAVTSGYLSAGNAVPSFTSYTLLFAISFTPSPALKVTLT